MKKGNRYLLKKKMRDSIMVKKQYKKKNYGNSNQ